MNDNDNVVIYKVDCPHSRFARERAETYCPWFTVWNKDDPAAIAFIKANQALIAGYATWPIVIVNGVLRTEGSQYFRDPCDCGRRPPAV